MMLSKYLHKTNIKWIKYWVYCWIIWAYFENKIRIDTFSVWSVEDEEGSITVGEAVSTEIGPDLFDVGLEDGTDDVIAVAIAVSPIDNDAICEGLADDAWPEGAMEEGANDAGIFVLPAP